MNDLVIDPGNREIVEAIVHVQSQHFQLDQMENKDKEYVSLYFTRASKHQADRVHGRGRSLFSMELLVSERPTRLNVWRRPLAGVSSLCQWETSYMTTRMSSRRY